VRTAAGATPDDCVAACLAVRQSQIASRACFHDEDRSLWSTTTDHHQHVVRENRCRRRYLRAFGEPPKLLARARIVTSNEVRCVGYELFAFRGADDCRRAP